MRLLFTIGVTVGLQTAQAAWDPANGSPRTNEDGRTWVEEVKHKLGAHTSTSTANGGIPTWTGEAAGKTLFDNWAPGTLKKSTAMARSEATFGAYANDYKDKMDQVENGIEGLAVLHSTHDEMWHRICAIAERGAKGAMVEFQKAILDFKKSMIDFRASHTAMINAKSHLETKKQDMIKKLQKWLTARKAHTHAHVRYVNFLHHLGLNYEDKNPAARYWREYEHGVTGRTDATTGEVAVGGWTPSRGPSTQVGKHSHADFINSLESVAATYDNAFSTNLMTRPFYNHLMRAPSDTPNWKHGPTNDFSHSDRPQRSQAGKADGGVTEDDGQFSVDALYGKVDANGDSVNNPMSVDTDGDGLDDSTGKPLVKYRDNTGDGSIDGGDDGLQR